MGLIVTIIDLKIFPDLLGWPVSISISYFVYWTFDVADCKSRIMDRPATVIYGLQAEAVWAHVEDALRTLHSVLPRFLST